MMLLMPTLIPTTTLLITHLRLMLSIMLLLTVLSTMIRLTTSIAVVVPASIMRHELLWHVGRPALQVEIHTACVGFGRVLDPEFLT